MQNLSKTVIAIFAVALCVVAQIQPVVKGKEGDGSVNWGSRTIVVTGIGASNPDVPEAARRPGALRAAKMIALRNALETVRGINLNSSTTVQNYMTTNDAVSTHINGYIKGFEQKGRDKYMSDGSVEVTLEIPLDGISSFLLGKSIGETPSVNKFDGEKSKKETVFTGLVVDCKKLKIKPSLSPVILDEDGKEVFGSGYVSKEWVVKYGIVGYAKSVEGAAKTDRVGDKPGQIKAIKASGDNSTDVVISNKDAAAVRSAAENLKFLSECRVIFVVD